MGKCPLPHKSYGLAWIIRNNKKEMAVIDNNGDAFKTYGDEPYEAYSSKPLPENKIDPDEYEFDRYFTSFDF